MFVQSQIVTDLVQQRGANFMGNIVVGVAHGQDGQAVEVDAVGKQRVGQMAFGQWDAHVQAKQRIPVVVRVNGAL